VVPVGTRVRIQRVFLINDPRLSPRAGARLARGRPPAIAASAAGAAAAPAAAVAAAPTRRARRFRERTRPRKPPRIQRRHNPLFENSERTSPRGTTEPDSGQLQRKCDSMVVRGCVHLPPRPRKRRTCSHVSSDPRLNASADRTDDEDVATSSTSP